MVVILEWYSGGREGESLPRRTAEDTPPVLSGREVKEKEEEEEEVKSKCAACV